MEAQLVRVIKADNNQVVEFLKGLIAKTYQRAGQQANPEDIAFAVIDLATIIKKNHQSLTLNDIDKAFENGIFGRYGKFFGLNVLTFGKWIFEFEKEKIKNSTDGFAITDKSRLIDTQRTMTNKEIDEIMQQAYERCRRIYDETGRINDTGNAVYDWLDSKLEIDLSPEKKRELYEIARKELIAEMKAKKDISGGFRINVIINQLLKNPDSLKQQIVTKAKKLALEMHFLNK